MFPAVAESQFIKKATERRMPTRQCHIPASAPRSSSVALSRAAELSGGEGNMAVKFLTQMLAVFTCLCFSLPPSPPPATCRALWFAIVLSCEVDGFERAEVKYADLLALEGP